MSSTKIQFNKLVRNRMPEVIVADGNRAVMTHIPKRGIQTALIEKLFEEAHEYQEAVDTSSFEENMPSKRLEELADILTVVRELSKYHGGFEALLLAERQKFDKRGGLSNGVFLIEGEFMDEPVEGEGKIEWVDHQFPNLR